MSTTQKIVFSLFVIALLIGLALGLRGITSPAAWAQAEAPAAPGSEPVPSSPPGTAPSHMPGPPPGAEMGPMGEPLVPVDEALKHARSVDLEVRNNGIRELSSLYTFGKEKARWGEIEAELRQAAQHGNNLNLRQAALGALGKKADRNVEILLQATYDTDPLIQNVAVSSLEGASPSTRVDQRLEELSHSPDFTIASTAVDIVTKRYRAQGPAGWAALIKQLGNPYADASAKAALQLVGVGRAVVPALLKTLSSSPNDLQRHAAALVLAMNCGGASERQQAFTEATQAQFKMELKAELVAPDLRVLPVMSDRLRHDPSPLVREVCAQALGYLGKVQAAPALVQALIEDPEAGVRARAASALIMTPGEQTVPALGRAVQFDNSPRVRRFAAEALGWSGDPRAIRALIAATQDPDPEVCRLAALQLGRLQATEAAGALIAMFDDPNEDVRWAAVRAVEKLPVRDKRTEQALVEAVEDPSVLVSHAAERALQRRGITRRKETQFRQG